MRRAIILIVLISLTFLLYATYGVLPQKPKTSTDERIAALQATMPSAPQGWAKTRADLDAERLAGGPDLPGNLQYHWAAQYESSLLPRNTHYPKTGDRFEAREDIPTTYMMEGTAVQPASRKAVLHKGEIFIAKVNPFDVPALDARLVPVAYKEMEQRLVPEAERTAASYGGFYFVFTTKELNEEFSLVSPAD